MTIRQSFTLIFLLFGVINLCGISFHDLNLSNDDRLLFRTDFESQKTLFVSRLSDLSLRQLTSFPEKLNIVDNGRTILAVNMFGAVKIPAAGGLPESVPGFPSFTQGNIPLKGRTQELAASADGRWVLYMEPTSPAYGNLILIETIGGARWVVSERIELPLLDFPASWSRDSRFFIYSKGGRLFYFPIISDLSIIANESLRQIGPGEMTSIVWGQQGEFFYLFENTLYRVLHSELLTRTIYGGFISIGNAAAVFPFSFDPGFDRYWIAPDSGSILINKGGQSLLLFLLGENQYSNSILPHVMIPRGAVDINVLWSVSGHLVVITSLQKETALWRFQINGSIIKTLETKNIPASYTGALSPDGTRAAFWGKNGLELWDFANWQLIQRLSLEPVFSCVWLNSRELIAGNNRFIEAINITLPNFPHRRICLSSIDEFGFEDGHSPSQILARTGTEWFLSNGTNPWTPVNNPRLRSVSLASARFRVYLEDRHTGHFRNIPMVRDLNSLTTVSLAAGHSAGNIFTQRKMQIALCFDLYDDETGLSLVLNALRRYDIKATFFMNGDFIRRNPLSASAVIEAGHEAASLFFAPIDLSDARYRFSSDFISHGLARNEDEFFRATGRELSLLWHPPFFRTSTTINSAATASGYTTVARGIDPGDWLSRDDALRLNIRQFNASEMIEQIFENRKDGAVIPVRLGLLFGGRDDYLFQRIDVLLDALIRSGCEIVPVSAVAGR